MGEGKLLIIGSRAFKKSTVQMLVEEGKKLFEEVLFVPINELRIVSGLGYKRLLYKNRNLLSEFDACYPRLSSKDFFFALPVLRLLEESSLFVPVSLKGYSLATHKFFTTKVLSDAGLPIVKSALFISSEASRDFVKEFGFPLVVKIVGGFAGKGVVLVENEKQLESILDTVHLLEESIIAQKFIAGRNSDVRCYVIGEKVIAVRRTGRLGEWRANISRGGNAEQIDVPKGLAKIALKAAEIMQLQICSVDFIETKYGAAIIEVNFMPGPFKKFLGNKIAKEMVEWLYKRCVEKKNN